MGYMRHHAILVTSWNDEIEEAHKEAVDRFPGNQVSAISDEVVNGYRSFAVFPDGSKEGWDASDDGDGRRYGFLNWLDGQRYEDGSTHYAWAEIQYGDENNDNRITRDSGSRP